VTYKTTSSCGASYFLTIVDDFSHVIWVTLLVAKVELSQTMKNFIAMTERQFNKQVKIVRSDNGIEFVSGKLFLRAWDNFSNLLHENTSTK